MSGYQPRIEAVLRHLDEFLAFFTTLIAAQRRPDQRKYMEAGKVVLVGRFHDLRRYQTPETVEAFVHYLGSLGTDMPYLDFDLGGLSGADTFETMKSDISTEALILSRDLSAPGAQAELASEWGRS